jgi:TDG/mug DNA glycosylase family protein
LTEPTVHSRLPDLLGPKLSVVFCGINPGLRAASSGHHFDGRNNRFWRVLHLAGFTPHQIHPQEDHTALTYGFGLTSVIERPTAQAKDISVTEFIEARSGFERKMCQYQPRYLAFLGKDAIAGLLGLRNVAWGKQSAQFAGSRIWVLPNPSGLNRAFSLTRLVQAYSELRQIDPSAS